MKKPRFSIITITYNAEKTLEPTLVSVLEQDYPEIEYIVIDGASTDKTMHIIEKYLSRIAHVQSEPDKGLYDAMNKGLQIASGDYVWFMNAGDAIHSPFTLSRIVAQLKELPDVIYGETAIIDASREMIGMRRLKTPEYLDWKSFRMGMLVCHQSFIAKRSIVDSFDLKYRFSADFDWCIKALKQSKFNFNTHLILSDYMDEGISTQNRKASLKERFDIMCRYYGYPVVVALHLWFAFRFWLAKQKA